MNPRPPSDASLSLALQLKAVGKGDRAALAAVYQRTSAKLFGVCLRILDDRSEAEEVLQETYIAVWRRAGSFDPDRASAITWLVTVARNKALDRVRADKARRLEDPLDAGEDMPDGIPSALSEIESAEQVRALFDCLKRLDPDQQAAIRTAFLEGATYDELARRRGVPLGTMKSWIRRGLISLRGCLGE